MKNNAFNHQNAFPPLLHMTYVLQHLSDEALSGEVGVGLSQVRILSTLHPDVPRSQRRVASQLKQTEANISRQLRAMQQQGLVSIKRNKKDGRQRDVTLTPKGSKKYHQAQKLLASQQNRFLRLFSKEESQALDRALNGLVNDL